MDDWRPIPVSRWNGRRRSRTARVFLGFGRMIVVLLSIIFLAVACYGWLLEYELNRGTAAAGGGQNSPQIKPLDGAIDILLVGLDSRTDAQGNPLPREVLDMLHAGEADGERQTDTMILVHIPQDGSRAVAISFPRDSYVEIAGGFGKHKLNSAYVYAYNDTFKTAQNNGITDLVEADAQAKEAGKENIIATIENFLHKPGMIDRYAEVNLASFYEITKAIGGVDVCLNAPVKERRSGIDLPAGKQTVEGVQALAFVRQRYELPNGDLDRIARQQAFLSGLANKVLSTEVLVNPVKSINLVNAIKKSVVLSNNWNLSEFTQQIRVLSGDTVTFHTIPVVGLANIGGADVVRVNQEQVQSFVTSLVDGTPLETSSTPPSSTTTSAPNSSTETSVTSSSPGNSSSPTSSSAPPPITADGMACVN